MNKRILAAVLLLCLFVSVVYAQSAATVFGWPPADGSVTPAKISSGYNLLTDAEKTQALTGSSTVDFAAQMLTAAESKILGASTNVVNTTSLPEASAGGGVADIATVTWLVAEATAWEGYSGGIAKIITSTTAVTILSDPSSVYSATKDTPGKLNLYIEGGVFKMQNNLGGTLGLRIDLRALSNN